VLDETDAEGSVTLQGLFVDLFEPSLPVMHSVEIKAGEDSLLFDLNYSNKAQEESSILVSSSRIRDEVMNANQISFVSESPSDITVSTRLRVPGEPRSVTAGASTASFEYDVDSGTVLIRYPGVPEGIAVNVEL
jgi:hypothetical protein